jgi:hypothetical protein
MALPTNPLPFLELCCGRVLPFPIGACWALRPVAGVCIRGDLPDFCGWVADGSRG